jgi:hypothetical protein
MKILFDIFLFKNTPENGLGQQEKIFCLGNSGGNGLWEINVKSKFSDFNKNWFPGVTFDAEQHGDHKKRAKPPLDLFRGDFHP